MKLTVGPLPPAVYWRRRVVLIGALLLAVLLLTYTCSGAGASSAPWGAAATTTVSATPMAADPTSTLLKPTTDGNPAPTDTGPPTPSTANTAAAPGSTGPCADTEMALYPTPDPSTAKLHQPVRITFRIKNVSNRTCTRDVGADPQELYIQQGNTKMWSSDACEPAHGTDVRTFGPGVEDTFQVSWDGRRTDQGCATPRAYPAAGVYQLVGRLASKFSDPVTLTITA